MSEQQPYRVEVEAEGCEHCGARKQWVVVDPDGVAGGVSFECKADADDLAEQLNEAYAKGALSGTPDKQTVEAAFKDAIASAELVNRLIDRLLSDDPHDMGAGPACGCCEALSYWQEQFRLLRASASVSRER